MVGTTRDNIHATVGSMTITWNPYYRSVEYPSGFHILSTTGGEFKRRAICLSKDLNEIFRRHHSRSVCSPPLLVSDKSVSEPCLIIKEIMYRHEGSTCPLKETPFKCSIYCGFSSTTFQSLGSYFFLDQIRNRYQPYCLLFLDVLWKPHVTWGKQRRVPFIDIERMGRRGRHLFRDIFHAGEMSLRTVDRQHMYSAAAVFMTTLLKGCNLLHFLVLRARYMSISGATSFQFPCCPLWAVFLAL